MIVFGGLDTMNNRLGGLLEPGLYLTGMAMHWPVEARQAQPARGVCVSEHFWQLVAWSSCDSNVWASSS